MSSETEARDREPSMVAAKPGMDADPRIVEFAGLFATALKRAHIDGKNGLAGMGDESIAASNALRAFFAALLAEPDAQWRIVMQAQADTIADLSAQLAAAEKLQSPAPTDGAP